MIERVIFTPEADDDVAGSYGRYESREPGLGEDFYELTVVSAIEPMRLK